MSTLMLVRVIPVSYYAFGGFCIATWEAMLSPSLEMAPLHVCGILSSA